MPTPTLAPTPTAESPAAPIPTLTHSRLNRLTDTFGTWLSYGPFWQHITACLAIGVLIVILEFAILLLLPRDTPIRSFIAPILTVIFITGLFFFGGYLLFRFFRQQLLQYQSGPDSLKNMPWRHLELLTAELFARQGYKVHDRGITFRNRPTSDGGIDLDLHKDGIHTVVQCKKWTTETVGVEKIRALHGSMLAEKAQRAIFVTTSWFTEEAERHAYDNNIQLIDNAALWELIQAVQAHDRLQELSAPTHVLYPVAGSSPDVQITSLKCEWCGASMRKREPKPGDAWEPFWGCSNYPKTSCRYRIRIEQIYHPPLSTP